MKTIIRNLIALSLLVFLAGCATKTKMAFYDDSGKELESENPIFLLTVNLRNAYKESYQPKMLVAHIEKPDADSKKDRFNFTMDEKAKIESEDPAVGNNYLLRMELDKGDYIIRGFTSQSSGFLINGFFFTPIHEELKATEKGIYYLGNVEAVVSKREGEEFKAGPSIPLIDQAAVGASGGTFDVTITDQWEKDKAKFLAEFPALANAEIKKNILPPFNKARAQEWWENN